ncbi:MAG TPA: serine/threonine-protein kinase [Planctomycetota bacterium]|nr:serine/threonine-protein kinase [Planctomycetota bacterium]
MPSQSAPTPGRGAAAAQATPSRGAAAPTGSGSSITRVAQPGSVDRLLGRVIGHCRLIKRLGRGGMGDVYLGLHQELQKSVAVKILPPDVTRSDELLARFRREAEAAARVDHPNIVEVYDIGCDQGLHYIIMGYVDGRSLQDLIDERKGLEAREAARIAMEIARGLQAVHADNIIHRDIKPANVLLSNKGEVKIVDFGLAFDAEDKTTLTVTGAIMGTPWYLSPEQAEGRRADRRSDLYSLGVVLYILATGERPFTGETHMSVLYKQIHETPQDPRLINSDVPAELAEIILRAMAKKPERRYQTADEFASDLSHFLRGTYVRRTGPSAMPDPVRKKRRRSALLTTVFVSWIVGLIGAVLATFVVGPTSHPAVAPASAPPATAVEPDLPVPDPLAASVLSDADLRQIAARDYGPVITRLLERHRTAAGAPERAALSKVGLRLSSAFRVLTRFRALAAHEANPAFRLRDGRLAQGAPVAALAADSILEVARKSPDHSDLDAAWFLILEGAPLRALDYVLAGADVRPSCRAQLDDLAEALLTQRRDVRPIADRLQAVQSQLSRDTAARLDSVRGLRQ